MRKEPCGQLFEDELTGDTYTCLMTALRDGGPGKVTILDSALADSSTHVTVAYNDSEAIRQTSGYSNGVGQYVGAAHLCTFAPPSFFQSCLDTPSDDCRSPYNWVSDCVEVEDEDFVCP